jgi:predicted unusual protein kinase regulating ubiquinone biosynthesis (AarF/ABC1/UbiB family)
MSDRKPPTRSRVPRGRLERLARIGWMAGEFAAGGVAEGARRLAGTTPADAANVFLTVANARRLARRLSRMRGAAMKLGQLLSLEGEDLLPPEFAEALAILRAAADAMPASQVRRALGREYGKGWETRFRHFDFEPLAAASIGQVHEATTTDGRELALKIQYPGVARSIDSDVDNLAAVLRLTRILPVGIDVSGIIAEAKRQLRAEADYHAEADNLRRYAALLEDDPQLVVPAVHEDFTTKRILAMDLIRGRPFEDLRGAEHPHALRDAVGASLQRLMFRELFEFRFMQTDPNFANYLFLPEGPRVALLDFGATREIPERLAQLYRRLFRAALARDRRALRTVAVEIGFTADDERAERIEGLLDLILLVCEPLSTPGVYDFGRSDLASRARDAGFELAFGRGFLNAPPAETIFLHRKLAGTFFLCARIRARVDARAILESFLGNEPPEKPGNDAERVNPRLT